MSQQNSPFNTRQAGHQDSQKIWEIRNHPQVRASSTNEAPLHFEEHDAWFTRQYFSKETKNKCYVLEKEPNGVIGYCRYDFDETRNCFIVSIAIDPKHQKQGLGHQLLSQSLQHLATTKPIQASVKQDNRASLKLFLNNQFLLYDEDDLNKYLSYRTP